MTDRPILFSAPMVRALLDGRKSQTRRMLKNVPDAPAMDNVVWKEMALHPEPYLDAYCGAKPTTANPRGMTENWCYWTRDDRPGREFKVGFVPGDRLWVRETVTRQETDQGVGFQTFAADGRKVWPLTEWRHRRSSIPSIHMPRWASRLTLIVTDVRVQRLQEISEADAIDEGCRPFFDGTDPHVMKGPNGTEHQMMPLKGPADAFQNLWNSLHGPDAWEANPWVTAVTFQTHHGNIDSLPTGAQNQKDSSQ